MALWDILTPASAASAAFVILLSLVYYYIKNRNIVPGPTGWPYLGIFPILSDEICHLQLEEYGKKYGDIFSFTFSGRLYISLGSAKALREVHINKSDCFSGRYTDFTFLTHILEDGVAMVNGDAWKSLRKFFIQSFKEYGLTVLKDNTAGPLYSSAAKIVEEFHEKKGQPFNIVDLLTERCITVMRQVLFGDNKAFDEKMRKMLDAYSDVVEGITGYKMLLIGPFGKLLFSTVPTLRKAVSQHKVMRSLLLDAVRNVESTLDEDHVTCVVEAFYKERNSRKRKNDPSWTHFSEKALVNSLSQMVGDGIFGVACFIGIFLHYLVKYPEEQDKIYKELVDVVGPSRLPAVEDKTNLPYTTAFMNEVMRTCNFFPLFASLECSRETTVRGYRIPKGAITLLNAWQAHHDPRTYENPDKFDPSRFIATPGKPRAELPVLFGIGKRACAGEAFSINQAFIFLTTIVKNFTISKSDASSKKSEHFLMTGELELCVHPRSEQ